jgi:murein L,D-transpeptidase YafK
MRDVLNRRLILVVCLLCAQVLAASAEHADRIIVFKSQRRLVLMNAGKEIRTYKVSLGPSPIGPKTRQGDHKTPEGVYVIDSRNAASHFYRALHVSYPNQADRARARKLGVSPGGEIMVHGLPNGYGSLGKAHLLHDWTDGCIAVTNEEMDEIWKLVPVGTRIEIRP